MDGRFFFIFFLAFAFSFASCQKDEETVEGNPSELVDEDHVKVDSRYGITAICEKGEWTNQYLDTCPSPKVDPTGYYEQYRYNQVTMALCADSVSSGLYATSVYLLRFHRSFGTSAEAVAFMDDYKSNVFDAFVGGYYSEVSDFEEGVALNGYNARRFTVSFLSGGKQEFYMIYKNSRVYSAGLSCGSGSSEGAYDRCMSVLNTVSIVD